MYRDVNTDGASACWETGLIRLSPGMNLVISPPTSYIVKRVSQIKDYANIILKRDDLDLNEAIVDNPASTTGHPLG